MTNALPSQLELLSKSNSEVVDWEHLDTGWQQRIKSTLVSDTSPSHLIYPHTEESLSEIITLAHTHNWKVMPCGSGSKLSWGGMAKDIQIILSTQCLNCIIDHAVGDLTVTVAAGVTLFQLQQVLKAHNQLLPLDPSYPETATIGGIIATADTGSWRQGYGGVRDLLLGLSFVRADGKIAKAGGRVVKNVAGYDLMKLFAGSYGTLGIITQATFRVYPLTEASTTLVLQGENNAIVKARQALMTSSLTPTVADLVSCSLMQNLSSGKDPGLILRFQSIAASVKEQVNRVKLLAKNLDLRANLYQDLAEEELWHQLSHLSSRIICKIGILPSAIVGIIGQLPGLAMINLSTGVGKLYLETDDPIPQVQRWRSLCQENNGFLTILEAPKEVKEKIDPWGYQGNAMAIMGQIKQKFDPTNVLNPGRFVDNI